MKKFIFIILCVIILIGCEKKEESTESETEETTTIEIQGMTLLDGIGITNVFSTEKKYFNLDYLFMRETHTHNMFILNERIYITAERPVNNDDGSYYHLMYLLSYDFDGGDMESFQIMPVDEEAEVRFAWYDSEYNMITIEELNYYYTLYKKNPDGEIIFTQSVEMNDIYSMVIGENDNIYIANKEKVIVYSTDGELICNIEFDNRLSQMKSAHGKKPIIELEGDGYLAVFKYINAETKSLEDIEMPVSSIASTSEADIYYGADYDYYYSDSNGLFGYDIESNTAVEVMDWLLSDISKKPIRAFVIMSPENMAMICNENERPFLFMLNRIPDDQIPQREIITLGWVSPYDDTYLTEVITSFNKNNYDYRIILKNYYSEELGNDSYQNLNLNIAAGSEPDLLYINDSIPILNYANKGMFVDMDTYLESEPELKADLLPFVRENAKINGQLPQVITSFTLQTLLTKQKNIEEGQYLTIEKLMEIYKSLPPDSALFNSAPQSFIQSFYVYNYISEYVNYDNGTCNFNTSEMKYFLELLKIVPDSFERITSEDDIKNKLRADELYFYTAAIYDPFFYIRNIIRPFMPEELVIVGYPTATENKRGDCIISKGFSIFNTSSKKDGAWEFIKYCISEEFYKNDLTSFVLLPTKSGVEYDINDFVPNREYMYITYNRGIRGLDDTDTTEIEDEGVLFNTNDFKNEYIAYIESLTNYVYFDREIYKIIDEEISTYLNSNKSIDDTIKSIQSRVSIYMSEMWG